MRRRTSSLPGDVVVVVLGSEINIDKQQQQQQQASLPIGDINKLGGTSLAQRERRRHWQECNQFNQQQPYFLHRRQRDYCRHRHNTNTNTNNHKHSLGSWQAAELSQPQAAPLGGGRRRYGLSTTPATFTTTTTTTTTATSSRQNNASSRKCYRWRRATLGGCSRRWLDCNNYDTTTKTKASSIATKGPRLATTSEIETETKSETLCLELWRRHSSLGETGVTSVCHAPPPPPSAAPSPSTSASSLSLAAEAAAATTEAAGKTLASPQPTRLQATQQPSTGAEASQGAPPKHKQGPSGSIEADKFRVELFGAFGAGVGARVLDKARGEVPGDGNWSRRPSDAMDILQRSKQEQQHQHQITSSLPAALACHQLPTSVSLTQPKIYPNNTLLADLSKCHHNLGQLWPTAGQQLFGCLTWRPSSARTKWRRPRLNYHMPDELLRNNPTLTLDDYDKAMSVLTGDVRYQLHLLLYKRVQPIWILLTTLLCTMLPILLLANLESLMIIGACFVWLSLQIIGAFATARFRTKLDEMLEKSVAQVNTFFMDHNLMLGVINVGSLLSKSRLIIPMLYFDTSQCREQIESIISKDAGVHNNSNDNSGKKHILDYSKIGLSTGKPNVMAIAQSQLAKKIVLRYSQRWISLFDRRKLMFTDDRIQPRHLSTGKCLCQFIEEHFRNSICDGQQQEANCARTAISGTIAQKWRRRRRRQFAKIKQVPNGKQMSPEPASAPIVIGKKDARLYQMAIPTLSKLVSAKENNQNHHMKIDMTGMADAGDEVLSANGYHNYQQQHRKLTSPEGRQQQLMANIEHNYFNYHYQNYYNQQQHSPTSNGLTNYTSTTISSADVSLENGGENVISRSDELVRKLRLLLELRKNELQCIDGSLFSAVLYKAPQQIPTEFPTTTAETMTNGDNNNLTTETGIGTGTGGDEDEDDGSRKVQPQGNNNKSNNGKRFYIQREGLFFLNTNAAKKSQQQQQTNRNHILEIC